MVGLDDPQTIIRLLANYLRPMLINSWKERRKAMFTENAERMKHLLDNLQKKLDEVSAFSVAVLTEITISVIKFLGYCIFLRFKKYLFGCFGKPINLDSSIC